MWALDSGHWLCNLTFLLFEDLCSTADDEHFFTKTSTFSNHILHAFLPPQSTASQRYGLRRCTHSFQLPGHFTRLSDCNFVTRMLYQHCIFAHFYPRDAMLARVIEIATCLSVRPSVCLSVRLSVTRRCCVKTKKASGMISSPSNRKSYMGFRLTPRSMTSDDLELV